LLITASLIAAFWFFLQLYDYWIWIGISILLTFLYSAPKLPFRLADFLKKIAVGKTIFLATVWMYVTSILPIILSGKQWEPAHLLFCVGRFFLIYSICIIFDFRDREQDRRDGIKSMITYFNESGINVLFYSSVIVYFICTIALYYFGLSLVSVIAMLIPGLIVAGLYEYVKKNFSDYLYYFILDGMMAFSALLTSFLPF
jgi:4-hydroxybenzoate polyprenyltransferase